MKATVEWIELSKRKPRSFGWFLVSCATVMGPMIAWWNPHIGHFTDSENNIYGNVRWWARFPKEPKKRL